MEICNIKELPSVYKDQIGDRLSSYKLIGVFDMNGTIIKDRYLCDRKINLIFKYE